MKRAKIRNDLIWQKDKNKTATWDIMRHKIKTGNQIKIYPSNRAVLIFLPIISHYEIIKTDIDQIRTDTERKEIHKNDYI